MIAIRSIDIYQWWMAARRRVKSIVDRGINAHSHTNTIYSQRYVYDGLRHIEVFYSNANDLHSQARLCHFRLDFTRTIITKRWSEVDTRTKRKRKERKRKKWKFIVWWSTFSFCRVLARIYSLFVLFCSCCCMIKMMSSVCVCLCVFFSASHIYKWERTECTWHCQYWIALKICVVYINLLHRSE